MKKLDYKWLGPYTIKQVISCSAYRLKFPASFSQIHPVFSVTLLQPFEGDLIAKHQKCHLPPPPPIIHDGVKEYEVEKILDSWIFCRKVEYLVCWKGYGVKEDEWHPTVLQSTCSGWRWVAYMHLSGSGNCGEQKESGF